MASRTPLANVSTTVHNVLDAKGKPFSVKVKSNSHVVEAHSDGALWDTVSNKYVLPEDTNFKDPK